MMLRKVQLVGSPRESLAITLPKSYCKEIRILPGRYIIIRLENSSLIIRPLKGDDEPDSSE